MALNKREHDPMPTTALCSISVKLNQNTRDRIAHLASARQRTSQWLMREAITQYVDREEKREAYRRDGIKAWNDFQATGLHVTQQEADAWLAKLGNGQDGEPPAYHV